MAKRRKKRGVLAQYFRGVLEANPTWLFGKTNLPILEQYRKDHGMSADAPIANNIKANLANLKSVMRRKGRKPGRPAKLAAMAAVADTRSRGGKLDTLEEMIDDAMMFAKALDRDGLEQVIAFLRRARNKVVWKSGE